MGNGGSVRASDIEFFYAKQAKCLLSSPFACLRCRKGFHMGSIAKELCAYMSARKKWWLMPILLVFGIVGGALVLAQGSAVAPFIYTVF